jgi:hypothetical protein
MNVSRSREITINMGNYGERYRAGATVTVSHDDLELTQEEVAADPDKAFEDLTEFALEKLNEELEKEIGEALELRDADEPSFVENAAPKRQRRTKRSR